MPQIVRVGPERVETGEFGSLVGLANGNYALAYFGFQEIIPEEPFRPYVVYWLDAQEYDESGSLVATTRLDGDFENNGQTQNMGFYVDLSGKIGSSYSWTYEDLLRGDGHKGSLTTPPFQFLDRYSSLESLKQAPLSNGNFIVVEAAPSGFLEAQITDAGGNRIGDTVQIAGISSGSMRPAVSSLASGDFAVGWNGYAPYPEYGDGDGGFIGARFFDASGVAIGDEFVVNTSTEGNQSDVSSAILNDGNVIFVWTDYGGNAGDASAGIKGQFVSATGVKIGGEFIANTTLAGNQQKPSVAVLTNGAIVVIWQDLNPAADDTDGCIRGQLFRPTGEKIGGEFLINTTTLGNPGPAEVAALADGRFVVHWQGFVQIFDAGSYEFVAPSIGALSANTALEYAASGAVVGTVSVTDASALTYSLVNDAGGRFAINAATGQVTVADGLSLDFEQAFSHVVRVRVVDASLNASEQDFTINIVNRTPETVMGDARANTFVGGAGIDNLTGGDGGDLLDGGIGADNLRGGPGNDRFYIDQLGDVVTEFAGQGIDTVFTTVSYVLAAGTEVETMRTGNAAGTGVINLTGNGYANTLLGNAGNNRLDGGVGADDLKGFGGNDLYFVDNAGDKIAEASGGGTDTAVASASYVLGAGVHVETLQTANPTGTTAINLGGNELNNVIRGNLGANVLRGSGGADNLYAGVDTIRDAFVYGAQGDSAIGAHDMIFNFTKQGFAGDPNSDKIDLRPIDADDDLAGNQAFRFVSAFVTPVGNQAEGQVMVQTVGADTKVLIDLNGDNTADMQIIVKAVTGLTAGDFWL